MKLDPHKDYGFTDLYLKDTADLSVWDRFRLEKIQNIFETCRQIIDFGNSSRMLSELFSAELKDKRKLHEDINACFHPDLVADICHMPMYPDKSIDGIICASILEHVYDPFAGAGELDRILESGSLTGKKIRISPVVWTYHSQVRPVQQ